MKVIRWWGIGAFLVIVVGLALVWYLLAPSIIKNKIEKYGTQALGAKVEVSSVELGLFPVAIALNQIVAADPDQPMQNIFQSSQVKFSIDSQSLLWKKLVIDELILDGVQTGTPRKTSGEISKKQAEKWEEESMFNYSIPEVGQKDIDDAVSSVDLITLKRVEALKQSQKAMEAQWKSALDKNAFDKRTNDIKNEYDRLAKRLKASKFNFIKDRNDWKKLKKSIDAERKKLSQLNKKLKTDKKQLADQLISVKNGPKDDLGAVKSRFGLTNGVDGVIDKYIGAQYRSWVYKAIEMVKRLKKTDSGEGEATEQQSLQVGNRVYFKDHHIFPEILIKKMNINGSEGERKLGGLGLDLGYLPWLTGKPAKLDLLLEGKGAAKLSVVSRWASEKEMLTQVNTGMKNWQLQSMQLMDTPEGAWLIESGILNAEAALELTLQHIKLNATFAINSPKLKVPESLSGWQSTLASSISQQQSINFKLTADGTLEKPNLKVSSSLAKLFTQAIGEKVKEKAAKYTQKIEKAITDKVGDLSSLESFNGKFDEWGGQIQNNDQILEQLLGKIKL